MTEEADPKDPPRDPPTPDRRGVDAGTWIWVLVGLAAAVTVIMWAASAGLPGPVGPSR